MPRLDPEILKLLSEKLGISASTVRNNVTLLAHNYPNVTPNARAHIFARTRNSTVWQKLSREDKQSLPNIEVQKEKAVIKQRERQGRKEKILQLVKYETVDPFRKGHIDEINRAYTYKCYTSVFILCRKAVENMLVDILRKKFPENTKENKELYFDTAQRRFKDFGLILKSFRSKSTEFDTERKLVERIAELAEALKDGANDKAHSWFHLVRRKREIDDLDIQNLIDLIKKLESTVEI